MESGPEKLPPPASAQIYELTPWGYEAEIIVREMGRWAARSPLHDPTLRISPVSGCSHFARCSAVNARRALML